MSRPTAPSPNIATLDSLIYADLCVGQFLVDITPSVFIDAGADNGLGVKVQITSPVGVVIKPYSDSYDIEPPFADTFQYSIPTQAGNYQYGTYTIEIQFVDADSTVYDLAKTVRICEPDSTNKTKKWGSLSATIKGVCRDGKVFISTDNVPNYRGKEYQDRANNLTVKYPTASGKDDLVTTHPTFTLQLYEGEYTITGDICATYNFGDNVYVNVLYKVKKSKSVKCVIDETCVAAALYDLQLRVNAGCSEKEKVELKGTMDDAFRLFNLAVMMGQNGEDPSDMVTQLETVLGCKCTCNCNERTPIINDDPTVDYVFEGCGFTEETVGLTKTLTIYNYDYETSLSIDNGGVLTISQPALDQDGCKKTQTLTFNISTAYTQIKNLADAEGEQDFWASVLKKALLGLDLTCMSVSSGSLASMTFLQVMQAIATQSCAADTCDAEMYSAVADDSGADVVLTFSIDGYSADIYLDGIFQANVLASVTTYTLAGAADGEAHNVIFVPKCTNGLSGTPMALDEFTYFGCPQVEPVLLSATSVSDATCPFDLTSLESSLVSGVTAEWHSANNTLNSSLVADPTAVSSGIYYVFAKDDLCYSIGQAVTVVCAAASSCTAPQTLLVTTITGGNRVTFQSAAFPPPSNSYTVKRRLNSDPDVGGSYTTIGTPTWNSTTNRWEILDATAVNNTLYTYRAISNCASSSPSIDYNYANIVCPSLTLTPDADTIDYSFTNSGGGISKYEVQLRNSAGTTIITTDTILTPFSTPITGTFFYLDASTNYKVRLRVYIGTYYTDCDFVTTSTTSEAEETGDVTIENNTSDGTISSFAGISGMSPTSIASGTSATGTHSAFTGSIAIFFSGGASANPTTLRLFRNGTLLQTIAKGAGSATTETFTSQSFGGSDTLLVEWF